jgi:hypothetical protein
MNDPRYPIGRFTLPETTTAEQRKAWIADLAELPANLRTAVGGLTESQIDTPYREGGWTIRQVVHHLADSHMNSYVRTKLALTEDNPVVKTYDEALWAELPDSQQPIERSLVLLDVLHLRWTELLQSLTGEQLRRGFMHKEWGRVRVDQLLALYSWHARHHVAHIMSGRQSWVGETLS